MKAVIFDMDGVLFDSQPFHFEAERKTTGIFGHAMTDSELKEYLGWTEDTFWEAVIRRYGFRTTVREIRDIKKPIFEGLIRKELKRDDELVSVLRELKKRGMKLAVASSSPMDWINMILSGLGAENEFGAVISGENVPRSKPAPDIFLEAARAIAVKPADCIVVEDAPSGIRAANSAGMRSLALLNKSNEGLDFSEAGGRIRKLSEILEFMDGISSLSPASR